MEDAYTKRLSEKILVAKEEAHSAAEKSRPNDTIMWCARWSALEDALNLYREFKGTFAQDGPKAPYPGTFQGLDEE